jgi:hypothetical protein
MAIGVFVIVLVIPFAGNLKMFQHKKLKQSVHRTHNQLLTMMIVNPSLTMKKNLKTIDIKNNKSNLPLFHQQYHQQNYYQFSIQSIVTELKSLLKMVAAA